MGKINFSLKFEYGDRQLSPAEPMRVPDDLYQFPRTSRCSVSASKKILIVLESRPFLAESIQVALDRNASFDKILLAGDIQAALQCAAGKGSPSYTFLVCSVSLLQMEAIVNMIRTCFPRAGIVLLDERIRPGCSLIIDRIDVQGYCSLYDPSREILNVLKKVVAGASAVAPSVKHLLSVHTSGKKLVSPDGHRQSKFQKLSSNEWFCFQHLLSGGELSELARLLKMETRSASNLKYRMLKKLSLDRTIDLFPFAVQWGFLDHAGLQAAVDAVE